MKEVTNDVAIVSLPHRSYSCEAVNYRVKLMPMPGQPTGGNHLFVIIDDRFEFMDNQDSRKLLSRIILDRYISIPPNRIHLVFFVMSIGSAHGVKVNMYNFDRDDNRQRVIKSSPVNFSENSAFCAMVMF